MKEKKTGWFTKQSKWLWGGLIVLALVGTFTPFVPSNAVRLNILQQGHPVAALLSGPWKMPQSTVKNYAGNRKAQYYQVSARFSNDSSDVHVLAVDKVSGFHILNRYVAKPAVPKK
ncbi:hypothetical protein IV54_GL000006 [Levilactobacillus paucivorans]|uniref:Uncharacterized protein n=1 Tax=Levilactobacillus paucivorans TaxID=616990 RepID=A0A0R2LP83_9LACO|nr:hypothetical protein [Levilactobacillus paucivorans]KRO03557.1 hypothetical protein IV54_GL000006 [Levilactobacillus paucivorans]